MKNNLTDNERKIVLGKIDQLRKEIDIEQQSILPALHNRHYYLAHSKIDCIKSLEEEIYDLYNHLINTNNFKNEIVKS
tara:strand:- start:1399 stop:1632 length:234 start_codon:yes stop_codon:yes gene_type:complete